MGTVDTALESWDIEFLNIKILGTIGVPRLALNSHLWVELVHFPPIFVQVQTCYFLGTMGTPMVPKIFLVEMYDIWAFKRRVARLYTIPECVCTIL